VIREFSFNAAGEFVILHTLEKVEGEPRLLAIWPVTQVVPPERGVPSAERKVGVSARVSRFW
jgi:hypothetical protein